MVSYHIGAAACLMKHGYLLDHNNSDRTVSSTPHLKTMLTGVSGGGLAASGLTVGVRPEDAMSLVLQVAPENSGGRWVVGHSSAGVREIHLSRVYFQLSKLTTWLGVIHLLVFH